MLGQFLCMLGSVHVATELVLLLNSARNLVTSSSGRIEDDRISVLPDDLLIKILLLLPTKDAVATAVLSKRWQYVWTMLPELYYTDGYYEQVGPGKKESVWWFLDQSLKLHKAPVLQNWIIQLGPKCPVDADVKELIAIAVDHRRVHKLVLKLSWLEKPIISLPDSLYICDALVSLSISDKILVDVPCSVCLPSLKTLWLVSVVYKDDDSLARLLSGCHILKILYLKRHALDNLKNVTVKVPSLKALFYIRGESEVQNMVGSLVIDSASLKKLFIKDYTRNSLLIKNRPRLEKSSILISRDPDEEFMRSLSSVMYFDFALTVKLVACCNAIKFSHLIKSIIVPLGLFDWLEPFMCFLQNSSKLKVLHVNQTCMLEDLPLSFNPPSSVPGCLSNHLEIFEWKEYRGRNAEKEVIRYILANSKCLKIVGISISAKEDDENRKKMMTELESMSRVSTSSQLLFSTQLNFSASVREGFND